MACFWCLRDVLKKKKPPRKEANGYEQCEGSHCSQKVQFSNVPYQPKTSTSQEMLCNSTMRNANMGCCSFLMCLSTVSASWDRRPALAETRSPLGHCAPCEPLTYIALQRNPTLSRVSICCMAVRAGKRKFLRADASASSERPNLCPIWKRDGSPGIELLCFPVTTAFFTLCVTAARVYVNLGE